jgi:LysM repeat protein
VAIARKLGVGYDELLKINGIEDPKKLQIGQTLKVPQKKN